MLKFSNKKIKIAITQGEKSSISPEIIAKSIDKIKDKNLELFVICSNTYKLKVQKLLKKSNFNNFIDLKYENFPENIKTQALKSIYKASMMTLNKDFDAIVTAPIDKNKEEKKYKNFSGHTDFLKDILKAKNSLMLMKAKNLNIAIATNHIPIKNLSKHLTKILLREKLNIFNNYLKTKKSNKIAVLSLNPHAGDKGTLGKEEEKIIKPVIKNLKNVFGPIPSDTIFMKENIKKYDGILAIYHDQGMIPVKMQGLDNVVNITLGLPIIRTSPGHGVAYDIVNKNIASPKSMINAIKQAKKMALNEN
jgi:4-hydroxythreonine-4-phosphate dehydrogenase